MERPKKTDEFVLNAAAELVAADLQRWSNDVEGRLRGIEHFKEEARYLVDCHSCNNGYELARILESEFNYEPDSTLVERLDLVWHRVDEIYRKAVREWVKGWPTKCPVVQGDSVTFTTGSKTYVGEVSEIDTETARCVVRCKSEGHKEKEGFVVDWEHLTAVVEMV